MNWLTSLWVGGKTSEYCRPSLNRSNCPVNIVLCGLTYSAWDCLSYSCWFLETEKKSLPSSISEDLRWNVDKSKYIVHLWTIKENRHTAFPKCISCNLGVLLSPSRAPGDKAKEDYVWIKDSTAKIKPKAPYMMAKTLCLGSGNGDDDNDEEEEEDK